MKRTLSSLLLAASLIIVALAPAAPAAAGSTRLLATPQPTSTSARPADVHTIVDKMSVADKVGQLFVVTFKGSNLAANSDIATLVRDYRVGGVVLSPTDGNFSTAPVGLPGGTPGQPGGQPATETLNTPQQIARLTYQLQNLARSPAQPITVSITNTSTATPTIALPPTALPGARQTATPAAEASANAGESPRIPLLIGLSWSGDDNSTFAGSDGFTPLPSAMAIGATWTPALAEKAGQVTGQELQTVGVNLLLGPPLDVLDSPQPGSKGDLGTRTFGGDPYWVGQMGRGFIRGVELGSEGSVVTAATHFPGQGGSDRQPEDEVATVQKSVQQLRQIELAPFAAVTAGSDLRAPGTTAILLTSHIRYRGFQGNIRQLTPPISLAPQLQDLMALKEFADWRAVGGVLMSDALGVPALRRYYDPQLQKFPHRQVAQDAFLAGNDLLFLSRFALTDDWDAQFAAIKETILFFQSKYQDDSEFRARVDASVQRIIQLKLHMYPNGWQAQLAEPDLANLRNTVGQSTSVTYSIARAGVSLIYPGRDELADRLPSAPLRDENILIFTDSRQVQDCSTCESRPLIASNALQDIILRLYGPSATGQVLPARIQSLTFEDLNRFMLAPAGEMPEIESAIASAKWIIFAQINYDSEEYAAAGALRAFLAKRSDSLRDKRLVVMAFNAPYYLDTTEISKLTAYFGVYGRSAPFLETAVRALFREFSPVGSPPVSVAGINYVLINQLEPAPGQIIPLGPVGAAGDINDRGSAIQVGSTLELETGVILDHNGHPVPDGTPVEFHLRYPTEALQLAAIPETTTGGQARTSIVLDRAGELWITVTAGEAKESARIVLKVGGDAPGSIATVLPSPTPEPTATTTPTPSPTPSPQPSPTPTAVPAPAQSAPPPQPRVALAAFLYGLIGVFLSAGTAFTVRRRSSGPGQEQQLTWGIVAALRAVSVAWGAYLLYSLGWLPGATQLQAGGNAWAAGVVTLVGGSLSMLWTSKWKASDQPREPLLGHWQERGTDTDEQGRGGQREGH